MPGTVSRNPRTVGGEVYRTTDSGRTWQKVNAPTDDVSSKAGYSFNQIRVDPGNHERLFVNSDSLLSSEDGGRTWKGLTWDARHLFRSVAVGDFRAMWIDPQDSDRMLMGTDGGLHVSYDGGRTTDHFANLRGGEFYAIDVDMEDPYHIYGGMQDHDSWRGPINGWRGEVGPENWITVGDNDGMYNRVDPTDSRWVYNTIQWGGHRRADLKTLTRTLIEPRRATGEVPLRFNWTPPLVVSPHNSRILYTGAQVLLRSVNRGDHWEEISPGPDDERLDEGLAAGSSRVLHDHDDCRVPAEARRHLDRHRRWEGAGNAGPWRTVDGRDRRIAAAGGPAEHAVTRVSPAHDLDTSVRDEIRQSLRQPGTLGLHDQRRRRHVDGAPVQPAAHPINVIVRTGTPDVLYVGTKIGVYVSVEPGRPLAADARDVAERARPRDLVDSPRESDLVVATYGRGLFVTHVGPVREMSEESLARPLVFFSVRPRARRTEGAWGNHRLSGDRHAFTPNEPTASCSSTYLRERADAKARVTVADGVAQSCALSEGPRQNGMNRVAWDSRNGKRQPTPPGDYVVTIEAAGETVTQRARLLPAPLPRVQ